MDLVAQLRRDEGVKYKPYLDTKGILTVGVGRNIRDVPFSDDEVNLMLVNDIKIRYKELGEFDWFNGLDDVRKAAIVNMAFAGISTLLHFHKMITALANKDWATANSEMMDSMWSHQVGERANRLAKQILTGEWQ